ncbi:hypothetical protein HHI36_016438 [Cryptolaemus montrouzieri]|uniref:Uncharacterized protein n=1 Tax=Cryptolaemus montrouzieri TaxID=559131 RepID=A0ABD2NK51_9CUCU
MEKQQQEDYKSNRKPEIAHEKTVGDQIRTELNQLRQLQETYKKRNEERDGAAIYFTGSNQGKTSRTTAKSASDSEYEELLERLRLADFLYTEYSLEEVIYQLAKVMFTQSLTGGNAEAQQALSRFMNFLEQEAEKGHISRVLEKKVLGLHV